MTTVHFYGTPAALKVKLDSLISGGATTIDVVVTHNRGEYIIIHN